MNRPGSAAVLGRSPQVDLHCSCDAPVGIHGGKAGQEEQDEYTEDEVGTGHGVDGVNAHLLLRPGITREWTRTQMSLFIILHQATKSILVAYSCGALVLCIETTSTPRPPRHQLEMRTKYE